MKFKIKYADQIVGIFSIAALAGLVILIFALGAKRNWFVKKNSYRTEFEAGSNISVGMDITYKGFSIGKVKSIKLIDDKVTVLFYVLEDYTSYVKDGSLVEVIVSPIGLGSQFVFHPGKGPGLIPAGSEIYRLDSEEGQRIVDSGMNNVQTQVDSIGALLAKVSVLVDNLGKITAEVNNALIGKGTAPLTVTLENLKTITTNLGALTSSISDPTGLVPKVLGSDLTKQINAILLNATTITDNLTSVSHNADILVAHGTPQIDSALAELNTLLQQVQDVMVGLKNNPLIKNGVPDRSQDAASTALMRSTDF
jgi:phospholipid/cholesterol/gamma-HCH transport system substrate-binding protein